MRKMTMETVHVENKSVPVLSMDPKYAKQATAHCALRHLAMITICAKHVLMTIMQHCYPAIRAVTDIVLSMEIVHAETKLESSATALTHPSVFQALAPLAPLYFLTDYVPNAKLLRIIILHAKLALTTSYQTMKGFAAAVMDRLILAARALLVHKECVRLVQD
jgi:hypothetical protein